MNFKLTLILSAALMTSMYSSLEAKTLNFDIQKKLLHVKENYSLGGQFTLKDSVEGKEPSFSASATWKPNSKNYWFIKGTARHDFQKEKEGFSYSWGLGYDDWHTGTWTVQLNNYQALKIGDGLNIKSAIASVGYKIDSKILKKHKLNSTITFSQPIEGDGSLSASLQWSPKKYWFIKGILVAPLDGGDIGYNYLFGYDDWHPKSFGFEYSNYGSNPLDETNFSKGRLALTYKWKFK